MKLFHELYQVGGVGVSHRFDASAYLVKRKNDWFLIDCGAPEGYRQILANIRKLGVDPARIGFILGTHGHYDHIGAAFLWKRDFGCQLYLQEADIPQVEQGDSIKTTAALLYGATSVPCLVDGIISEGDGWEANGMLITALETPGHTMGSVSFEVTDGESRFLIAGDALWGGYSEKIGSNEKVWRKTLEKITERHYDFYHFGHVGPQLIADADQRLKEAKMAFGNYYNPWFKSFYEDYQY